MAEKGNKPEIEEVLENEIDDIWDIFFPYAVERKEGMSGLAGDESLKPRRHLRFLTM